MPPFKTHGSLWAYTPRHAHILASDAGNDAGGGGDTGGGGDSTSTTTAAVTPSAPNWAEFASSLDRLNDSLGGKLDGLVTETRTIREASTAQPDPEPVDLESLSRPELVAHITSTLSDQIRAAIAEAINPVVETVNSLQSNVVSRNVSQEIEGLRAANKDFGDWKDDMVALAREHPTLGVTALYRLAKANAPDKAKTLDLKYNPPAPKRPLFALAPSGNGSQQTTPLTHKQASEAAYREVQARHPDVLRALEDM